MCIEVREIDNPKQIVVVEHYCLAILESSIIEGIIRKHLPKEIITNINRIKTTMMTVQAQNNPNIVETNPNDTQEQNYAYGRKIVNS